MQVLFKSEPAFLFLIIKQADNPNLKHGANLRK